MAIRRIDPKSAERPVLPHAGLYGPGAENEADVVVQDFIAEVTDPKQMPNYDREGKEGPYCLFMFRVKYAGGLHTLRAWQTLGEGSGSQALNWLRALGVAVSDNGEYDDREVIGKKCILDVKAPRTLADGSRRTGDVRRVVGL